MNTKAKKVSLLVLFLAGIGLVVSAPLATAKDKPWNDPDQVNGGETKPPVGRSADEIQNAHGNLKELLEKVGRAFGKRDEVDNEKIGEVDKEKIEKIVGEAVVVARAIFSGSVDVSRDIDENGESAVDIHDLVAVGQQVGKTSNSADWETAKTADVNGDLKVDQTDLDIIGMAIKRGVAYRYDEQGKIVGVKIGGGRDIRSLQEEIVEGMTKFKKGYKDE